MLLHRMVEKVQNEVDDINYWTSARVAGLLNDGVDDIISRLDVKVQYYREFDTEDGRQNYDVPLEYIATEGLYYNSGNNRVIFFEDSPMDLYGVVTDVTTEGYPTHCFIYAVSDLPEMQFYPVPDDAYTMQHWYIGWAPELVNDNDESMLPRFLHKHVVDYAKMRIKVQDKEMSEVQFRALWKDNLREMRRAVGKRKLKKRQDEMPTGKGLFPTTKSTYREERIRLANTGGVIWE